MIYDDLLVTLIVGLQVIWSVLQETVSAFLQVTLNVYQLENASDDQLENGDPLVTLSDA